MPDQGHEEGITVFFAAGLYDIEALKRAAYRFSDRVAMELLPSTEGMLCRLMPTGKREPNWQNLEAEFRTEVLDQELRQKIAAETEPYRNLVLSLAFSKTPLAQ